MNLKKWLVFSTIFLGCFWVFSAHSLERFDESETVLARPDPIATLHRLQAAQDSMARGDKNAVETQARLLSELGVQLGMHDEDFLKKRQNFYTILLYLVHGGNPEHVQHLLDKMPQEGADRQLINGILAYTQGREGDFHAALGRENLPHTAWPSALRASIYLALTPYISRKNPELADERLDYIRLVAPGSLFEEAAVRRQIKVAARLGNKDKISRLVRHYTMRFPNSPYIRDFWSEVMEALSSIQDRLEQEEIEKLLAPMPDKLRIMAYLQLARRALLDGHMEQASTNAQAAQMLANLQDMDDHLAQFYQLAAKAATTQAPLVALQLQDISLEELPERDHALAHAARNVAQAVSDRPIPDAPLPEAQEEENDHTARQIEAIVANIRQQLNEIDTVLEKAQ